MSDKIEINQSPNEFSINVPWDILRQRKVFIATPMYGGQCAGGYTKSLINLIEHLVRNGMPYHIQFLFNESLITRARNYLADLFLRSDCTHMLFLDSDIEFETNDVMMMLAMSGEDDPYDVLCASYPMKMIAWEKVMEAVNKGRGDDNPNALEYYTGDFTFNPVQGQTKFNIFNPVEIAEGATGFMLIKRSVFDKYREAYPEQAYLPDHRRTEEFDGTREIHAFFDCIIDPVTRRYLSEDYMFSYMIRKIGLKIWMCPWMKLKHIGTYTFSGTIEHLGSIGVTTSSQSAKQIQKKGKAL